MLGPGFYAWKRGIVAGMDRVTVIFYNTCTHNCHTTLLGSLPDSSILLATTFVA